MKIIAHNYSVSQNFIIGVNVLFSYPIIIFQTVSPALVDADFFSINTCRSGFKEIIMNIKFAQVPSRWLHCVSYTFVCDWVFLFHFTYFENVTEVGAQPYSIRSSLLCAFSFIISVQPTAVLVNKRLNQPKKLHLFKVCRTPFHSFFTEWWNVKLEIIATIVADFPQKLRNK